MAEQTLASKTPVTKDALWIIEDASAELCILDTFAVAADSFLDNLTTLSKGCDGEVRSLILKETYRAQMMVGELRDKIDDTKVKIDAAVDLLIANRKN